MMGKTCYLPRFSRSGSSRLATLATVLLSLPIWSQGLLPGDHPADGHGRKILLGADEARRAEEQLYQMLHLQNDTTTTYQTIAKSVVRSRRQSTGPPGGSYVYDSPAGATDAESGGPWGPWQVQGLGCSRTCGGGVLVESRACNGDNGVSCEGPSKRYSSCNVEACPPGSLDIRQMQCSKYDSVPFERKLYQWIPYLRAPRRCELNCMPRGERFYYRHEKKVSYKIYSYLCSIYIFIYSYIIIYINIYSITKK